MEIENHLLNHQRLAGPLMHRGALQRLRGRVLLPARRRLQHVLLQLRRVPRVVVGRHVVALVPNVGGHDPCRLLQITKLKW